MDLFGLIDLDRGAIMILYERFEIFIDNHSHLYFGVQSVVQNRTHLPLTHLPYKMYEKLKLYPFI